MLGSRWSFTCSPYPTRPTQCINTGRKTEFLTHITFIILNPDDAGLKGGVKFLGRFILLRGTCFRLLRDFDHLGGSRRIDRAWCSRSWSNLNRTRRCRSRDEGWFDERSLSFFFLLICLRRTRGRRGRAGNCRMDSLILNSKSNFCLVFRSIKDDLAVAPVASFGVLTSANAILRRTLVEPFRPP